jgi:collagenase-like PrtC family protease
MIFFSIPADFKAENLIKIQTINQMFSDRAIAEVYGQISEESNFGSGRAGQNIPQVSRKDFEAYLEELHKLTNVSFNYTFNASCLGNLEFTKEGIGQIKEFFIYLHKLGIDKITVASPAVIEIIKGLPYHFELKASAICQIGNPNKALEYKNMGVNRIVLDEDIHRQFDIIKNIQSAFEGPLELIVNSLCRKNCVYKNFHYNQQAHDYKLETVTSSYFDQRCMIKRLMDKSDVLKINWIRPEDLHYYYEIGIQNFKIQGRQAIKKGNIYETVLSYMNEEYEGNLFDLLECFMKDINHGVNLENKSLKNFIEPFVNNPDFCSNDCSKCNYCGNYLR